MNTLQIIGWVVAGIGYLVVCRWVYLLGYGRTPRDVCEPVKVLSTGERNPASDHRSISRFRPGDIFPYGSREDLNDFICYSTANPNTFSTALIRSKREIEASIGHE